MFYYILYRTIFSSLWLFLFQEPRLSDKSSWLVFQGWQALFKLFADWLTVILFQNIFMDIFLKDKFKDLPPKDVRLFSDNTSYLHIYIYLFNL